MSTLLKWNQVQSILQAKNIKFLTPRILNSLYPAKTHQLKYFLETQTQIGTLIRLKPGLYINTYDRPSEGEIANHLYQPSYISFEYALAYYNILPEMVYVVTSATTKPTREFNVVNRVYNYTTIKVAAYTGYELKREDSLRFQIADPAKALTDYLYLNALGRRAFSERLYLSQVSRDQVLAYAQLYHNQALIDLIHSLTF